MAKAAEAREIELREFAEKQAALSHLEQKAAEHPHEGDSATPVHVVQPAHTVAAHPFEGHVGSPHVVHPAAGRKP